MEHLCKRAMKGTRRTLAADIAYSLIVSQMSLLSLVAGVPCNSVITNAYQDG